MAPFESLYSSKMSAFHKIKLPWGSAAVSHWIPPNRKTLNRLSGAKEDRVTWQLQEYTVNKQNLPAPDHKASTCGIFTGIGILKSCQPVQLLLNSIESGTKSSTMGGKIVAMKSWNVEKISYLDLCFNSSFLGNLIETYTCRKALTSG